MSLVLGAILAFLSVATGAFAAHGLKESLDAYSLDIWKTAAYYQMIHALALVMLGIWEQQKHAAFIKIRSGFLFGIFVFSGSLYLLALTGQKWLGMITPFGGLAFMISWVAWAWCAWQLRKAA